MLSAERTAIFGDSASTTKLCLMSEAEFIQSIDCCFPYAKPLEWRRLSARASRISANAAFMVIHEICRAPRSISVSPQQAQAILGHLRRRFRHPLLPRIEPAIQAYLSGRRLRQSQVERLIRLVSGYRDQYNALALCYFAADDRGGRLDRSYNKVVANWSAG